MEGCGDLVLLLLPETGHRTPDIGHAKWFYILSNAAMHCIGQTIMWQWGCDNYRKLSKTV